MLKKKMDIGLKKLIKMENNGIEFNMNFNWYGFAIGISVFLILFKALGFIDCSIWIALSPIFILLGITCLIVFIVGLITCYLILSGGVSDEDNESDVND